MLLPLRCLQLCISYKQTNPYLLTASPLLTLVSVCFRVTYSHLFFPHSCPSIVPTTQPASSSLPTYQPSSIHDPFTFSHFSSATFFTPSRPLPLSSPLASVFFLVFVIALGWCRTPLHQHVNPSSVISSDTCSCNSPLFLSYLT